EISLFQMSRMEEKRPSLMDLAHVASLMAYTPLTQSPLTQTPETAESPILLPGEDEDANPHLHQGVSLYVHTCQECAHAFDCEGDYNGQHVAGICISGMRARSNRKD